jgi:hypothetical protein
MMIAAIIAVHTVRSITGKQRSSTIGLLPCQDESSIVTNAALAIDQDADEPSVLALPGRSDLFIEPLASSRSRSLSQSGRVVVAMMTSPNVVVVRACE